MLTNISDFLRTFHAFALPCAEDMKYRNMKKRNIFLTVTGLQDRRVKSDSAIMFLVDTVLS